MYLGKISTKVLKTSLGMPSSSGALSLLMLITTFLTSCRVNFLSSSVSIYSCDSARFFFCNSVSSSWLSSGVKICSMWWMVPWRFVVSIPCFCFSVIWGAARLSLPLIILYIPLHGLVVEVKVQYSFQGIFVSLWLHRTLHLRLGIVLSCGHVGHCCLSCVNTCVAVR